MPVPPGCPTVCLISGCTEDVTKPEWDKKRWCYRFLVWYSTSVYISQYSNTCLHQCWFFSSAELFTHTCAVGKIAVDFFVFHTEKHIHHGWFNLWSAHVQLSCCLQKRTWWQKIPPSLLLGHAPCAANGCQSKTINVYQCWESDTF